MSKRVPNHPHAVGWAAGLVAIAGAAAADAKNWSDWSAPASFEAIPGSSDLLNTAVVDGCSSLSPDGLELYFTSSRAGSQAVDIWVARRSSTSEGFGDPVNVGAPINSASVEFCPTITQGKRLYFSSLREGGGDLYVSRLTKDGWSTPQNLGPNVNSSATEESASVYEDKEGREVLVFSSRREGRGRIYQSIDGGPAELVAGGVNSSAADQRPSVRKDGLEIFWDSTRSGLGNSDLFTATRSSTSEQWGTAVHLESLSSAAGPPGDGFTLGYDARPFLSWDGSTLFFGSVRPGGEGLPDGYYATREKITGN